MARAHGPARGPAACLMLFLFVLLAAPAVRAFEPNFDFYPKDAQSCLYDSASASHCQGSTSSVLNSCLCGNGGDFVLNAARCIGKKDVKDVGKVYDIMVDACARSSTPLKLSRDDFLDASSEGADDSKTATSSGSSKTASPTSATGTASSSSTATASSAADSNNDSSHKPKLSTAATISVAASVSVAGVAAIAGLAFFLVRRRKRSTAADEAHPMLPHEKYRGGGGGGSSVNSPNTFFSHAPSPSLSSPGFEQHGDKSHYSVSTFSGGCVPQQQRQSYTPLPMNASPGTPQQQQQQQQQNNLLAAWEPPTNNTSYDPNSRNSQYVGPYAAPQGGVLAELPPQTQPVSTVFELDSFGVARVPSPQPTSQPMAVQSPQPAVQPMAVQSQQQQHSPREYTPYIPK